MSAYMHSLDNPNFWSKKYLGKSFWQKRYLGGKILLKRISNKIFGKKNLGQEIIFIRK